MLNKIKLLSKSSTSQWMTIGATVITLLVSNQELVATMLDTVFGSGVGALASKLLTILSTIAVAMGVNISRLKTEEKPPLSERL